MVLCIDVKTILCTMTPFEPDVLIPHFDIPVDCLPQKSNTFQHIPFSSRHRKTKQNLMVFTAHINIFLCENTFFTELI